jgi:carboxyl-terminal processing protease
MMDGNVGYLELISFSESSTSELRDAIRRLVSEGARGVILDLRGNPGGLLDQGVAVADLFLDRGKTVVETKGRAANQNQRAVARSADQFPGLPVVVLVGPQSASASEIVAGALQDHDRALVLGRTTYGKGSVQSLYPLENNNWLKITTARWYTPAGRSIQKPYGIDAHLVEDEVGEAAAEDSTEKPTYRTDSGRTVYGGGGIHPDLVMSPDTLTPDERQFVQAMQRDLTEYFSARLDYAVTFLRENPNLQRGFAVTPAMLDRYFDAIRRGGVTVERDLYDQATRWVTNDLGYEITLAKWGQEAARQRTNADDPQVRAAADLLRRATSPASLFTLAESAGPGMNAAREPEMAPALR